MLAKPVLRLGPCSRPAVESSLEERRPRCHLHEVQGCRPRVFVPGDRHPCVFVPGDQQEVPVSLCRSDRRWIGKGAFSVEMPPVRNRGWTRWGDTQRYVVHIIQQDSVRSCGQNVKNGIVTFQDDAIYIVGWLERHRVSPCRHVLDLTHVRVDSEAGGIWKGIIVLPFS